MRAQSVFLIIMFVLTGSLWAGDNNCKVKSKDEPISSKVHLITYRYQPVGGSAIIIYPGKTLPRKPKKKDLALKRAEARFALDLCNKGYAVAHYFFRGHPPAKIEMKVASAEATKIVSKFSDVPIITYGAGTTSSKALQAGIAAASVIHSQGTRQLTRVILESPVLSEASRAKLYDPLLKDIRIFGCSPQQVRQFGDLSTVKKNVYYPVLPNCSGPLSTNNETRYPLLNFIEQGFPTNNPDWKTLSI